MSPERFLRDAHRNGHRGEFMLRRWAMKLNTDRRNPADYVTTATLETAIRLESAQDQLDLEFGDA